MKQLHAQPDLRTPHALVQCANASNRASTKGRRKLLNLRQAHAHAAPARTGCHHLLVSKKTCDSNQSTCQKQQEASRRHLMARTPMTQSCINPAPARCQDLIAKTDSLLLFASISARVGLPCPWRPTTALLFQQRKCSAGIGAKGHKKTCKPNKLTSANPACYAACASDGIAQKHQPISAT